MNAWQPSKRGELFIHNSTTFASRTLWHVGWRYLLRHPWQSVLMVVGITLGVAVVVAIDLANASASRAFDLSADTVAGRATHQIVGGGQGLDEAVYLGLRRQGVVRAAAPVVADYVSSAQLGGLPLQLLGVDPFAEAPFRSYLSGRGKEGAPVADLATLLTRPGAVLISAEVANRYGLAPGASLSLDVGGHARAAFLAGRLQPADDLSRRALDGIILADIATAQELTGRLGLLDHVDLILSPGDSAQSERIAALLPPNAHLVPVAARSGAVAEMAAAFRTNLLALSLLALVVGMFLIYNTMTFSVVQRRPLFGTLRCLGATRAEVFALVVSEALIVGALGALLGVGLGVALSQGALRAVTQTINDLYFVLTVTEGALPLASLGKGVLLGVFATVLAAVPPAWEAAMVPPRTALVRSTIESKARRLVVVVAAAGLGLLLAGAGLLALPTRSLGVSFAGTFVVVMAFAMLAPLATVALMRAATPLLGGLWGTLGRMAPRDVVSSLSRTAVAVAALMVALAVTVGVSLMIGSFRHTVADWLGQVLQGDVYVAAPSLKATQPAPIDAALVPIVRGWPGAVRVDALRSTTVDSPYGPLQLAAVDNPRYGEEHTFAARERPPAAIWAAMEGGAVAISEPLANRLGLRSGGTLTLFADDGPQTFPIVGVYYDYASSQGIVSLALPVYRRHWRDEAITALSLRLAPAADAESVARALQEALAPQQRLLVRPNRALRADALVVFDRTFAITAALQLLATAVAFVGVLSALLALQMERQHDFGVLRAVGLTIGQLWRLVLLESGLLGAVAGLLALPAGFALSLILIYIINRRSFGWTLQMQVEPAPFVQAVAVGVVAALLASIYPLWRMTRTVTAESLRLD